MLELAICDENILYHNKLENKLKKYLKLNEIDFKLDKFLSVDGLMDTDNEAYSIVFVDAANDAGKLLQAADFLRSRNRDVCVVICSDSLEFALEGYKAEAVRYLLKDDLDKSFDECMEAVLERLNINTHGIQVSFVDEEKYLHIHKIGYLESKGHYITFYDALSGDEIGKVNSKLDILQSELYEYNFLRIHKSFLVNMVYIKRISGYRCILENGVEISVPKARYKDVKNKFMEFRMR